MSVDKPLTEHVKSTEIFDEAFGSVGKNHYEWLDKAIEKLKYAFDNDPEMTLAEKTKVFKIVEQYAQNRTRDPAVLLAQLKSMPEQKQQLAYAMLQTARMIDDGKSKSDKGIFY